MCGSSSELADTGSGHPRASSAFSSSSLWRTGSSSYSSEPVSTYSEEKHGVSECWGDTQTLADRARIPQHCAAVTFVPGPGLNTTHTLRSEGMSMSSFMAEPKRRIVLCSR